MISRAIALIALFALFAPFGLMSPTLADADEALGPAVRAEIDFLLQTVERSGDQFIRNGKDHDGQEAARHMRRKFEHYLGKGDVHSAEDFIRLAGTGSLISGRPYRVRLEDGSEIDTAVWLSEALAAYRASGPDRLSAGGAP
jgi:hypothetical protein